MISTALGCSLVVLAVASPAAAQDECGAATPGGTAVCTVAGGPYPNGVFYGTTGGFTLTIEPGVTIDGEVNLYGPDAIVLDAADGSILRGAVNAVNTGGPGSVSVTVDRIEALAPGGYGLQAYAVDGNAVVSANHITADLSGIFADGRGVTVTSGTIELSSSSLSSTGIDGSATGDIVVSSGSITGAMYRGIRASAGGDATVDSGSISMPDAGVGIVVDDAFDVRINSDSIVAADGGIQVFARGGATIDSGSIVTTGEVGHAVVVDAQDDVVLAFTSIETSGRGARGLSLQSYGGSITVTGGALDSEGRRVDGDVTATGDETIGVALTAAGDVTAHFGEVSTTGDDADGMAVESPGSITLTATGITTSGLDSDALEIEAASSGDVNVEVTGSVSTTGQNATAVRIGDAARVTLDIGSVSTMGDNSDGVVIASGDGVAGAASVDLTVGDVTTAGFNASAIGVQASGPINITAGAVTTGGQASRAISAQSDGDIAIRATSVRTSLQGSNAITALSLAGDVSIDTGDIETGGPGARGVDAGAGEGRSLTVVAGDVTTWDTAVSALISGAGGAMALTLGDVSTRGRFAQGISVQNAGSTVITVGQVSTMGDDGRGITASGGSVSATVGGVSTSGSRATAMQIVGDDIDITVTGALTTTGADSHGVMATADGDLVIATGAVDVTGLRSRGVVAAATGAGSVTLTTGDVTANAGGIHATADQGDIAVHTGNVLTSGDVGFSGIHLESAGGAVTLVGGAIIGGQRVGGDVATTGETTHGVYLSAATDVVARMGAITTAGAGARGLVVESRTAAGEVDVGLSSVATTGANADGVSVIAAGDAALALGRVVVSGAGSNGVLAEGASVVLNVGQQLQATGVGARLLGAGTVTVDIATGASVSGGALALDLTSADGTRVTNGGTISSASGLAMDVDGGAATVVNSGVIVGRIDLTDSADTVTNSGTFRARGVSDFGAGADVFTNTGVVALAESSAPVEAVFANLERFNNAGLVDLANGVAGDIMTFGGAFATQAGGRVEMDLDLRQTGAVADRLIVGSVDGQLEVQLQVQGAGRLGDTGVTLVRSGSEQTGTEVEVRAIGGGFLDFDTQYDAASREYRLMAQVADQAYEPTKVASGAQTQWRRSADVISARFDEMRDAAGMGLPRGERAQLWGQVFTGSEQVDGRRMLDTGGAAPEAVDLSHDVDTRGVQFGADVGTRLAGGDLVMGLAASLGRTELVFQSNGDRSTFDGVGVGGYAQWTLGDLSIAGLVKADFFDLDYRWSSADLEDGSSGDTIGARIDAAWRLPAGEGWVIEPQVSLAWTQTDLGDIQDEAGRIEFGDTTSVLGKAGLRMSRALKLSGGAIVQPYIGLHRLNEFDGENASRIVLSHDAIDVVDESVGGWSQISVGANIGAGAIQGFVQGESLHGDVDGYAVRVGARLSW